VTEKNKFANGLVEQTEADTLKQLARENTELRQKLELLTSLLDNLPGMAYRCLNDYNYTFEYASKGAREFLGVPTEQLVGAYAFRQLVPEGDQAENDEILSRLTPENDTFDLVYRLRSGQGEYRWVQEQGKGLFSPEGKLVALDGLLTDITEQKNEELALRRENTRLRFSIDERYKLGRIIGKSKPMLSVYKRIVQAAGTRAPVIIHGESGTGKELAAHTIHEVSDRKDKPFIAVNCGAIPESLMESEFFGHVRGAFTGANTDRGGHLMAANNGTLFLDEIGEMPLALQVKLLRVLDGGGFSPVGSSKVLQSNFRLISATNRDLSKMVRLGTMREDFYYRINTVPILMPPLRDRLDDLPLLIDHFMELYQEETGEKSQIPPHVIKQFESHDWPGNVRELTNVIRRYLTLKEVSFTSFSTPPAAQGNNAEKSDSSAVSSNFSVPVADDLAHFEKNMIIKALNLNQWNMGNTAKALGISRRTLQRRVNKYKIK